MLVRPTIPDARHTATFAVALALALALTVAVAVARQLVQCHLHFAWLRKNITTAHENVTLIIRNAFCHNYNFEYLDILAYLHFILKNDFFRFRVPFSTIDYDDDDDEGFISIKKQKIRIRSNMTSYVVSQGEHELYKSPLNDKINILFERQVIKTSRIQRTLLSRSGDRERERVSNGILKKGYIKQFVLFATNRNIDTIGNSLGNSFIAILNVLILRNIKTASMSYIKALNENLNCRPETKFNSNLISHFKSKTVRASKLQVNRCPAMQSCLLISNKVWSELIIMKKDIKLLE
uniref:Uncharacterized protein n=1 Tax=Glossina pallidipes TaxID=7398 RepID=A0A1B0AD29_GLOPL